ncbi:hypothetical protein DRP07_08960 [Archaeoglobales archaeon]|nr:MAG: hypothetical protein DRP07_08960 [Archaeoglobales archaeon]
MHWKTDGNSSLGRRIRDKRGGCGRGAQRCPYHPFSGDGTPTVIVEKLPRGTEIINAFKALGEHLGKEVYVTMPIEAGG